MISSILVNGFVLGGVYSILAVSFSLVFGVARILNLAHTAFYMVSAFLLFIGLQMIHLGYGWAMAVAFLGPVVLSIICYKALLERVREQETAVLIITVALAMLFNETLLLKFGQDFRYVPSLVEGFTTVSGVRVTYQQIIALVVCGVSLIALWLLLASTRLGNAIQAVSNDKEAAGLVGIDVSRIYMIVIVISVAFASIAGVVVSPIYVLFPGMWVHPLVLVLASVVLGGLGSLKGSILGAFILGFGETIVVFLIPEGSFLKGALALCVMIVVLGIRPEGLFGVLFEEERL